MNNKILFYIKNNIIYSTLVILLLVLFTLGNLMGFEYFPSDNVQKNAGFHGPIAHSGYGVRFYHK